MVVVCRDGDGERDIKLLLCVLYSALDDETSVVTVGAQSIYACAQIAEA